MIRIELNPVPCRSVEISGMPTRILIVPGGMVRSSSGDFVLDAEGAKAAIRQFEAKGIDLVIDYEHQTLGGSYAARDGKAPAAGWITKLEYEPGRGLFALVHWTGDAVESIRDHHYRYLSPVVLVGKSDRKMLALHSAALTNKPAIVRMPALTAVANADGILGDMQMADVPAGTADAGETIESLIGQIKNQLGLEEGDALAVLMAVLKKLKGGDSSEEGESKSEEVASSLRQTLQLGDDARLTEVVAAIEKLKTSSDDQVPKAEYVAMSAKLEAVSTQLNVESAKRKRTEARQIVKGYVGKGQITEALGTKRIEQLVNAKNFEAAVKDFEDDMSKTPAFVRQGQTVPPEGMSGGTVGRETVIHSAARKYHEWEREQGGKPVADLDAWINGELMDAGYGRMTADERKKLVVA